jgi:peptidoglycan/xylan/chitin deacetylase (PgdA/CDA1 family)
MKQIGIKAKYLIIISFLSYLFCAPRVISRMKNTLLALGLSFVSTIGFAAPHELPFEVHQTLITENAQDKIVALTLDACGGSFDADIINYLTEQKIPATIFVTQRWLNKNPTAFAELKSRSDLFDIEDHGAHHVPAVVGPGRQVYGIAGSPDMEHLKQEVSGGADAIEKLGGAKPRWYRGATAEYDRAAIDTIKGMGYQIAGFSVNADAGATLPRASIIKRLKAVKNGDIIIAHMNKPRSDSAEGLIPGLGWLVKQGFRFVKLNQFAVRDVTN